MTVAAGVTPLDRLKAILAELMDLRGAESLLDWDSRVSMPPAGAEARAHVLATLSRLTHERLVSGELALTLEEIGDVDDEDDSALIRITRREVERARRVPGELAAELAHAAGVGVAAWDRAKETSDFDHFAPFLERLLDLRQRYVECFPEKETPYDVLLDDYEEGTTTAEVRRVFDRLKEVLLPLVAAHRDDAPVLRGPFPPAQQQLAGRKVLEAFGYDETNWRIDETPHPFAQKPGLGDIRLTTHTAEGDLTSLFSTMHEFGHGLYEFDIDDRYARTPLGRGTSSILHESQSRTWENLVGRSRGFWRWFYPQLQPLFPDALGDVDEETFVRAVSAVHPGPLRGYADEATYGLHIVLRFELELELFAGTVSVRELPEAWNAQVREYLGVDVPDDAHGVLQDMHWSAGVFGYFPTYQLGNVASVQIWERAQADLGDLEGQFERGEFRPLREWLREHIYRHGSKYQPRELLRRVTGSDLDPEPYVRYLQTKFA
jgi:carboxypeptidase Taq